MPAQDRHGEDDAQVIEPRGGAAGELYAAFDCGRRVHGRCDLNVGLASIERHTIRANRTDPIADAGT